MDTTREYFNKLIRAEAEKRRRLDESTKESTKDPSDPFADERIELDNEEFRKAVGG